MREIWANWANDHRQYSFLHTSLDLLINTLCLLLLIVHPNLKGRRAYIHDWWNSKQNICISKIYKKSHINMYAGILVLRGYTYTHAQTHTQKQPISIFVSIFFLPNPPPFPGYLSISGVCRRAGGSQPLLLLLLSRAATSGGVGGRAGPLQFRVNGLLLHNLHSWC